MFHFLEAALALPLVGGVLSTDELAPRPPLLEAAVAANLELAVLLAVDEVRLVRLELRPVDLVLSSVVSEVSASLEDPFREVRLTEETVGAAYDEDVEEVVVAVSFLVPPRFGGKTSSSNWTFRPLPSRFALALATADAGVFAFLPLAVTGVLLSSFPVATEVFFAAGVLSRASFVVADFLAAFLDDDLGLSTTISGIEVALLRREDLELAVLLLCSEAVEESTLLTAPRVGFTGLVAELLAESSLAAGIFLLEGVPLPLVLVAFFLASVEAAFISAPEEDFLLLLDPPPLCTFGTSFSSGSVFSTSSSVVEAAAVFLCFFPDFSASLSRKSLRFFAGASASLSSSSVVSPTTLGVVEITIWVEEIGAPVLLANISSSSSLDSTMPANLLLLPGVAEDDSKCQRNYY